MTRTSGGAAFSLPAFWGRFEEPPSPQTSTGAGSFGRSLIPSESMSR